MKSRALVKAWRVESPVLLRAEQYRVIVPVGASLLGALVTALLENLNPDRSVALVETVDCTLRPNDVLIERGSTGRTLVVFGTPPTRGLVAEHLANGVVSLIGIDASRPELVAAIESLDGGPAYVSSSVVHTLASEVAARQSTARLTARELDVLRLIVSGQSNREIADRLFVSPNTVRSHLQSISTKLGVTTRAKLAAFGRSLDLTAD